MVDHLRRSILRCVHRAVATSGSWRNLGDCPLHHEVSDDYCDVFLVLCTKCAVTLHRKCDVRRVWALSPRICSSWRAAWLYTLCARVGSLHRHLSGIPSNSLTCFNFLLPHFRLTLEFSPTLDQFFTEQRSFCGNPLLTALLFNSSFPLRTESMLVVYPTAVSIPCCAAWYWLILTWHVVFTDTGLERYIIKKKN